MDLFLQETAKLFNAVNIVFVDVEAGWWTSAALFDLVKQLPFMSEAFLLASLLDLLLIGPVHLV